jgi:hypothetical protein
MLIVWLFLTLEVPQQFFDESMPGLSCSDADGWCELHRQFYGDDDIKTPNLFPNLFDGVLEEDHPLYDESEPYCGLFR